MHWDIEPFQRRSSIAYFTMEIALRPEMHTYSGGLGVLAGDTARSAADLNLPMVFVSLISRQGYLHQKIDAEGQQVDLPDPWNPSDWCTPLAARIAITLEGRTVWIRPWLFGCSGALDNPIPVILLDTDLDENDPADRQITDHLYGGDTTYRLKQEAILGIGGLRILRALGFTLRTFHLNEGHAAFLTAELLKRYPRQTNMLDTGGPRYDSSPVMTRCLFTTHTPVEAGHDRFPYELVERVLGDTIDVAEIRRYAGEEDCNMTKLALNLSAFVNGVATRHAETTQQMFPGYKVHAITNGVHAAKWAFPAFAKLFDESFPYWKHEPELLFHADHLPDADIVAAKKTAKSELIYYVTEVTGVALDPELPIIGYARRMTAYKRPSLILSDPARLKTIAAKYPVQIVWAGKAHPADTEGTDVIHEIKAQAAALTDEVPMAFLPNYDTNSAQLLVAGADIWLNTPRPPLEASGTSGMKAALNGTLNLSTIDGWWVEAWIEDVTGWAIGTPGDGASDKDHALSLYDKLENTVLPLFANDQAQWIWMMKQSIAKIAPYFNSHRMMRRYVIDAYLR
ncbi:MAG: alpha-glucan family phosphorylase [Alphaproteobacteria bacterium]